MGILLLFQSRQPHKHKAGLLGTAQLRCLRPRLSITRTYHLAGGPPEQRVMWAL